MLVVISIKIKGGFGISTSKTFKVLLDGVNLCQP